MAKNKMQVKYKQPKRVRNKSKEIETDNKLMSAVKTVLGVLIAMVLMYLMMFVMEKLGVFEAGYTKPDSGETTISNEYFTKVLGITSRTTIKKCCDLLILMGLIERTTIVDTSQKDVNGKILTKEYNQYKLRPYSEFRKRYNDLCCNKRNLKK